MWSSEAGNKFLLTPQNAILKNIIYEILRECDKRNFLCEKKFVTFVVHLMSVNQENGINFNTNFDRSSVEKFIDNCLKFLIDEDNSPANITLKMQVHFIDSFNTFDDIISEYFESLTRKTNVLVKEITETQVKSKDELGVLQKKMIIDIILHAALGNPSNNEVVIETTNALNSVMTESDLENFAVLDPDSRMESLKEIRKIVCGIILFNKDTGVGLTSDENIPDLPKTLENSYESVESLFQFTLCDIMDRVNILTSAFDFSIAYDESTQKLMITKQSELTDEEINIMKDLLILNRQHEIYVRKLLGNLKITKTKIDNHIKNFNEMLFKLHEIVQFRSAVPSIQIFPKFRELAEEWLELHNISYALSHLNQINNFLQHLSEICKQQQYDDLVYKLLGDRAVESDYNRLNKTKHLKIQSSSSTMISHSAASKNDLEYLGFCSLILAESKILLPSNPEMGVFVMDLKNYAFSSLEAADIFLHHPVKKINRIIDQLKKNVHLIMFFNAYKLVKKAKDCKIDTADTPQAASKISLEKEVQTELHPIPSNIDPNYVWNLWSLRRKALELANLRNKKTSSAQTMLSYQKFEIDSQTVTTTTKHQQTMSEKYTSQGE